MPAKPKFTRIPKVRDLVAAGVPVEAIPTYCALTDYTNNRTGLCWPKMQTLARTLGRSVRTIQRHLHLLKEKGLIEFVDRRRLRGRYSSYLYRVLHIATTGREEYVASILKERTKPRLSTKPQKTTESDRQEKRRREAKRRREGFEWLFE